MENKVAFYDVDTQNDFMLSTGALYVPGAENLIGRLATITNYARTHRIPILGSVDAHTEDDPEFEQFPPHCIKGTLGQEKVITPRSEERFFEKQTYDIFTVPEAVEAIKQTADEYVVYGVATDYCVKAVVEGMLGLGKEIKVVRDIIAGVDPKESEKVLHSFADRGVSIINLENILNKDI